MDDYLCQHHEIRDAVIGCVSFWQQNHQSQLNNAGPGDIPVDLCHVTNSCSQPYVHAQCSVMQVAFNDKETSYTTTNGSLYNLPSDVVFEFVTMRHFDTVTFDERERYISQTRAASVQITTKKHHSKTLSVAGYMVLLFDRLSQWRCISAAFGVLIADETGRSNYNTLVKPTDMKDVISCVWDGYCISNRACDGVKMAEVFHETCRLTYVDVSATHPNDHEDDGIRIWDCTRFCQKVTNRYRSEPPHIPFAHLRNDALAASGDELLGVEFAQGVPCVAMVTLKVGHPPFLWTDILTCAKLGSKWYIVHKSSTSEPFLTHMSIH